MTYLYHSLPSVLDGLLVRREPGWPLGASGQAPVVPLVERQRKRGPRNALVETMCGARFAVPFSRTVRRIAP
jgi:hypothetical protein